MRKRMIAFLLCFVLTGALSVSARAESFAGGDGWQVAFTETHEMDSTFRTAELDDAVSGLQPGDDITFQLTLRNDSELGTDWYMTNRVLYSLEDRSSNAATSGGAYSYYLSYADAEGAERVLFSSDTVGGGHASAAGEGLHLVLQFHKPALPGAGDGLVGAGDHGSDGGDGVDAGDGHAGDDGGAVRVGNDAAVLQRVGAVDLRHDQGHIRLHAEGGTVVDIHRAAAHDGGGEGLGHAALHSAEHVVHALEGVFVGFLHGDLLPAEGNALARAARAGQKPQLGDGDGVLLQNVDHFAADRAGGAENGDLAFFHVYFSFPAQPVNPS